ncbi:MAG: hypothetical protein GY703_08715 [Gammaproteobacteria bacterium]|nr:hypothetical protein [Gammaproteobacteria bacterium]
MNQQAAEETGCTMEIISAYMKKRGILRMASDIDTTGKRLADIVDNTLSFARKNNTQASDHSMSELIDKTISLAATDCNLRKRYDFKAITINRNYEDNLPKFHLKVQKSSAITGHLLIFATLILCCVLVKHDPILTGDSSLIFTLPITR